MKDPRVATLEGLYLAGDPDVQLMIRAVIEKEGVDLNGLAPETLDALIEMCGVMVEQLPDALHDTPVIPGAVSLPDPADTRPKWPGEPCRCRLIDGEYVMTRFEGCRAHGARIKVVDQRDPRTWVEVFPGADPNPETPVQPLPPRLA